MDVGANNRFTIDFRGISTVRTYTIIITRAAGNAPAAPSAPRLTSLGDAAGGLNLEWDALAGADSYRLRWRRKAEPGAGINPWMPSDRGETAASPKMLRGLQAGMYEAQVAGFNTAGLGAWSPAASGSATAPAITLTPAAARKIYGAADPEIVYTAMLADSDTAAEVFASAPLARARGEDADDYAFMAVEPLPLNAAFRAKYAHFSVIIAGDAQFTIAPKSLTYASTAADKVYDGGDTPPADLGGAFNGAVVATLNGIDIDDTADGRLRIEGGAYAGSAAGDAQTLSGFTLAGAAAGNYALTATVRGDIRRLAVTYTDTADARAYDGSADVTGTLDDGVFAPPLIDGDAVNVDASGAMFADADAGTAKPISGLSASGAASGNYDITFTAAGDITPKEVRVGAVVLTKVYDGDASLAAAEIGSGAVTTGVDSETLSLRLAAGSGGEYAKVNAGSGITLNNLSGADFALAEDGSAKAANYALPASITATGTISKRPLRVRAKNLSAEMPPTDNLEDLSRVTVLSGTFGEGLVAPDTAAQVLRGAIAFGAQSGSAAPIERGTLAVTSGLPGGNYALFFIEGVFTYLDPNRPTLVLTPTTTTRVYGAAEPAEFAYSIAPQSGSSFESGDDATSMFFTANPIVRAESAINNAGAYDFRLAEAPQFASGIREKYNFLIADGAQYTITKKPLTFSATAG
ncbi:MAG: YDG domain-containing protein, partial [Gammaproteobacteria bacterium]